MELSAHRQIDRAFQCADFAAALDEAAAAARAGGASQAFRIAAAVAGCAGESRTLARYAAPAFPACRSAAEFDAVLGTSEAPSSDDLLVAGMLASRWSQSDECRAFFDRAHRAALAENRIHVAVAALERLSHHAFLFGEPAAAAAAIDGAIALASRAGLHAWRAYCAARAVVLALAMDDAARAGDLLASAGPGGTDDAPRAVAAFGAYAAVRFALATGDAATVARHALARTQAVPPAGALESAALACALLLTAGPLPLDENRTLAMRRALALVDDAADALDFLGAAIGCAGLPDARTALDLLSSAVTPARKYADAHYRLARAQLLLREGDRSGGIDAAGDAARAFDAIGLRRWTNEAMLLLVRYQNAAETQPRRRPSAVSLTPREQQVAHLVRRGASNREVARALQISEHTVERHVSSILSRLGLRSRWQIVDVRDATSER